MTSITDPIVELTGLRKHFGSVRAVEDVSFTVAEGEIFGILGPNGAGKTTSVECLAGLQTGDAGTARVAGIDPWTDHDAVTRVLGVQLQESQLQQKITVAEALTMWSSFYDDPRPWDELAERLGLAPHLGQRFAALSGGQQQRLSIALALVGRPGVVILDELTTGLDPRARQEVWQLVRDVRDEGTTVLLVTHAMEEAEQLCDRIAIIDAGRVRALDTPEGLIAGAAQATTTSFATSRPITWTRWARSRGSPRSGCGAGGPRWTGAKGAPSGSSRRSPPREPSPFACASPREASPRPTSTSPTPPSRRSPHDLRHHDRAAHRGPARRTGARLPLLDRHLPHRPAGDPRRHPLLP